MKKNSKLKLIYNFLFLLLLLALMIYIFDHSMHEILMQLSQTSGSIIVLVIVLGSSYQLLEGYSIQAIVAPFQSQFTWKDGFWTSCYIAFYRVISFGTGTLLSEVYFYKKKGLMYSQGVGVTALHMIMYKATLIFMALLGMLVEFPQLLAHNKKIIPLLVIGILLTFVLIFILLLLSSSLNFQVLFIKIVNRWFKKASLRHWVDEINLRIYSLRDTVKLITQDRSALTRIFGWNVCKLSTWFLIPCVVLYGQYSTLSIGTVFFYTSFAVIVSGVLPTPAGLGSFEFVYLLLFSPMVGTVDAVSSLLLYRFASFVLPFFLGFFYVLRAKRQDIKVNVQTIQKRKNGQKEE